LSSIAVSPDLVRQELRANNLSLIVSFCSGTLALLVGLVTDSGALLLDSSAFLVDLVSTLILARIISTIGKGPNDKYPYGYAKLEPLAATVSSLLILGFCAMSAKYAVQDLIHPDEISHYDMAIHLGAVTAVASLLTGLYLARRARALHSVIIRVHAIEWLSDSVLSFGLFLGFFIAKALSQAGSDKAAALVDPIMTLVLASILAIPPLRILRENILDLIDASAGEEVRGAVMSIIHESCPGGGPIDLHNLRVRKAGRQVFVDARFTMAHQATAADMHAVASAIRRLTAERLGRVDTVVSFCHSWAES